MCLNETLYIKINFEKINKCHFVFTSRGFYHYIYSICERYKTKKKTLNISFWKFQIFRYELCDVFCNAMPLKRSLKYFATYCITSKNGFSSIFG